MGKLAVVPPNMMDEMERKKQKCNESTLIDGNRMAVLKAETIIKRDLWSEQERQIFTEKYKKYPKKFGFIALFLTNKVSITILPRTLNKIPSQWLFSTSLHIDC